MSIFELHQGLPREGPGDDESTEKALRLLPDLVAHPKILDIGCGPGAQTLVLARTTKGTITAVDRHQPFLEELSGRARSNGFAHQIRTVQASMEALPFEPDSFDLIWAEGSIFVIGFERGLSLWTSFVRSHGYIVISELTWLSDKPPKPARQFWSEGYPAMASRAQNRATIERRGLIRIADFVLPTAAWFKEYLDPLAERIAALKERYGADPNALRYLESEETEINIVRRYGKSFGYVFYLAQRP